MAEYTSSPFLNEKPYKPHREGFVGQDAGGCGSYGLLNSGKDHRQPVKMDGTMGPDRGVAPSETYRRLVAKTTGVNTSNGVNPPIYGKKSTY